MKIGPKGLQIDQNQPEIDQNRPLNPLYGSKYGQKGSRLAKISLELAKIGQNAKNGLQFLAEFVEPRKEGHFSSHTQVKT